uniref:C2 domain-containing protein n=1 Tax=Tetradesmus obliquus TaxID=3088 RepID=A0A383VVM2_TETOB|eukprot:jgi/Sobl393_1/8568/SZX69527.1
MASGTVGYLVITAIEASGKNKDENYVWDSSDFEGYVKVELRGGARNIKVSTKKAGVQGTAILWNETMTLEVLEGANELRVMLCRDKLVQSGSGVKRGTSVIAACGIFVSDILDAVPIDKYFELFKPSAGGEGGFIRLGLDFVKDPNDLPRSRDAVPNGLPASGGAAQDAGSRKRKGRGAAWKVPLVLLSLAAAGAGGFFGWKHYQETKDKDSSSKKDSSSSKDSKSKKK